MKQSDHRSRSDIASQACVAKADGACASSLQPPPLQAMGWSHARIAPPQSRAGAAATGTLPAPLRCGLESLSGLDLGDVRVHANSPRPAAVDALAFAQGRDIHLAPGQERHLPHEAWHVVQQRQGRVQATGFVGSERLNDDERLEREADAMGRRALATPGLTGTDGMRSERAAGRDVAGPASPLQRFRKSTKTYTTSNTDPNVAHMFSSQSIDPLIAANDRLRHDTKHEAQPRLYFSDDRTVAINKAKGREAREFYADPAVIADGNHLLTLAGSAVQLVDNPAVTVTPPGPGATPLRMVKPSIQNALATIIGDAAHFGTSVCVDVAMKVMGQLDGGRGTRGIFEGPTPAPRHEEDFSVTDTGSKAVYHLTDFVAQGPGGRTPSTEQLHTAMSANAPRDSAGEAYGRKTKSAERIARARQLAINEFARPEVGEGFATFSTRPGPSRGGKTWGYHYAGVVARSTDGRDWVTLENYNRAGDLKRMAEKVYKRILKRNKAIVTTKIAQLQQVAATMDRETWAMDPRYYELEDLRVRLSSQTLYRKLKELLVAIRESTGADRAAGEADFNDILNSDPNTKWFFHMYGSGSGQSFHEQAVKSNYFKNPITLRVSPS